MSDTGGVGDDLHPSRLDHGRCCELAAGEVLAFADALDEVGIEVPVETCPGWSTGDVARHLGGVHRWAAYQVSILAPERVPRSAVDLGLGEGESPSSAWVRAVVDPMTATLAAADPDAPMWGWGADKHARFWPRRMIHETAVHRADLVLAGGGHYELEAEVAADGVDELLDNLPHAAYFAPRVAELKGEGETTLHLHATDVEGGPGEWTIHLGPAGYSWDNEHAKATVAVRGPAAGLLLVLYGRLTPERAGVEVFGESGLLDFWIERSAL